LQTQITATQHAQAIARLHDFVEQLRFLDNAQLNNEKLSEIAAGCNRIWEARQTFAATTGDESEDHPAVGLDESLRRDLLDLAVLSARLDVQLAQSGSNADAAKIDTAKIDAAKIDVAKIDTAKIAAARQQALQKLNEAQQMCGSSPLLDMERRDYQNSSDTSVSDVQLNSLEQDHNAWEHYAIGRWLMHHGALADAERQLAVAIDLQPDEFWANFQQTRCHFELEHFQQALTSASVCIALAPNRAECFYNRALCYQSLGRDEEALADFGRALELDPTLAPAALARGALLGRLQRYAESRADLESALAHGSRPSDVYYQLARLSLAQHDHAAAGQWLQKSLAADPGNATSLALEKELAASAQ
jgi:tetratricopeptide (TPR) repeat protein